MQTGKLTMSGHRAQAKPEYRDQALLAMDEIVSKFL